MQRREHPLEAADLLAPRLEIARVDGRAAVALAQQVAEEVQRVGDLVRHLGAEHAERQPLVVARDVGLEAPHRLELGEHLGVVQRHRAQAGDGLEQLEILARVQRGLVLGRQLQHAAQAALRAHRHQQVAAPVRLGGPDRRPLVHALRSRPAGGAAADRDRRAPAPRRAPSAASASPPPGSSAPISAALPFDARSSASCCSVGRNRVVAAKNSRAETRAPSAIEQRAARPPRRPRGRAATEPRAVHGGAQHEPGDDRRDQRAGQHRHHEHPPRQHRRGRRARCGGSARSRPTAAAAAPGTAAGCG